MEYREEKDALGTVLVPAEAHYGPNTQRAVENFINSGLTFPPVFIWALALIKKCAAEVNRDLGLLTADLAAAIVAAAQEVLDGKHDDQFVVDIFQTGSGTSTNMNVNEVLASRANELLTGKKGGKAPVHPNDHVNLGQSSNDVIPSAIHVAALHLMEENLIPSLAVLHRELQKKAVAFAAVPKMGRTHLQDAIPILLGQEFGGYARQVQLGIKRVTRAQESLSELALGGTAVGSGLNTHPEFATRMIDLLNHATDLELREAEDHFEAQGAQDAAVEASGALKTVAVGLIKIANDIRWMASGPRCGLGELRIPALQPGSSIMPGKVNPVIPEAVMQAAAQVIGNDATIALGGLSGVLELNVMLPVIAYNLLQSIDLLANSAERFATKCIAGIEADPEHCRANLERSLALVTYLVPRLGYDQAATLANEAYATGRSIRETVLARNLMSAEELSTLLPESDWTETLQPRPKSARQGAYDPGAQC